MGEKKGRPKPPFETATSERYWLLPAGMTHGLLVVMRLGSRYCGVLLPWAPDTSAQTPFVRMNAWMRIEDVDAMMRMRGFGPLAALGAPMAASMATLTNHR